VKRVAVSAERESLRFVSDACKNGQLLLTLFYVDRALTSCRGQLFSFRAPPETKSTQMYQQIAFLVHVSQEKYFPIRQNNSFLIFECLKLPAIFLVNNFVIEYCVKSYIMSRTVKLSSLLLEAYLKNLLSPERQLLDMSI
jgi:hypothetical protein